MATMGTAAPRRGAAHEAMAVFLGDWTAEGTVYGVDGDADDPRAGGVHWVSGHTGRWHSGGFFLVQDERALAGGETRDTLAIMGVDPETGDMFMHAFENHGHVRRYEVSVDGDRWSLEGDTQRARIVFRERGRRQEITWQVRRADGWLPLSDRTAFRTD